MQEPFTPFSSEVSKRRIVPWRGEAFNRLVESHPYLSTLLLFLFFQISFVLLRLLFRPLTQSMHLPSMTRNLLGEGLLALLVAVPILFLRWWSETGFTRGINGRGVLLCLLPTLLIAVPGFSRVPSFATQVSVSALLATAVRVLLIGFAEEGLWRGQLLRTLLPGGIWSAVLLSSLGFAGEHLSNLWFGSSWDEVIGQIVTSFGGGMLLAAVRLRTGSLWPALLLHAAHDFPSLLLQTVKADVAPSAAEPGVLFLNILFCVLFLLSSLLLLNRKYVQRLRVTLLASLL